MSGPDTLLVMPCEVALGSASVRMTSDPNKDQVSEVVQEDGGPIWTIPYFPDEDAIYLVGLRMTPSP